MDNKREILSLLRSVAAGEAPPEEALLELKLSSVLLGWVRL